MKILLLVLALPFLNSNILPKNEINGIIIYDTQNLAISNIVLEIPIYSITIKSSSNGSFKVILPENIRQNEDIYIYIKVEGWQMIEPARGDYVIVKPHQRNNPLIIRMQKDSDGKNEDNYNKEKPQDYTNVLTDKEVIQIQVGANKESDFKDGKTIDSEKKRLKKLTGYNIKHFKLKYDDLPHRFVIDKRFTNEAEALDVKSKIRKLNSKIKACFFNNES